MNYFERLVRRALRRPADAPGTAMPDPFENVADWPLEVPPVTSSVPAPSAESSRPHLSERDRTIDRGRAQQAAQMAPSAAAQPIAPPHERALPNTQSRRPDVPPADRTIEPRTPVPPPPNSPGHHTPGLQVADAFMQSIGVAVPGVHTVHSQVRVRSPLPMKDREVERTAMPAEPPRAQVVPRAPRPPDVRTISSRPSAPDQARRPAGDPELPVADRLAAQAATGALTAPGSRMQTETRRVVIVERQSGERETEPMAGGGAPHFGLGQL